LALGGRTVAEWQQTMSSREFSEWMAYSSNWPFGEYPAYLRAGIVASTIANANRDPKKRKKPFSPVDFMPNFDQPQKEKKSPAQLLQIVEMLNAGFGGKDLRKQ
jgi:hypothetical protein